MMKFTGFLWGGAAILATIGGWAFWLEGVDELTESSDRVVERVDDRVDRVVDRVDERVDRTTARIDRIVDSTDARIASIDRAIDHAVDRPNPRFSAEMERLEAEIEAGSISRREAIDRAVQASIDGGRGPGTPRSAAEEEVASARAIFAQARAELETARADVQAMREAGEISMEDYSSMLVALGRAEERIAQAETARQY